MLHLSTQISAISTQRFHHTWNIIQITHTMNTAPGGRLGGSEHGFLCQAAQTHILALLSGAV